ncbi:ATP-binding protein [Sutterella sp.]|uniref:ATP-binding protein n=1 Tax=Sutterella sp. TaxID=1981025 RepID=UPI0026DFC02F|nr:ATP-binding protein [Sutterella sp.]MDO5531854.1 ATP-binding protein [Sutterella sp.]
MKDKSETVRLTEPEIPVGREDDFINVLHTLDSAVNLILRGPRHSGKTTICIMAAKKTGRPFVCIPCETIFSEADFARQILPLLPVRCHMQPPRTIEDALRLLERAGETVRPIVIFDEFPEMVKNMPGVDKPLRAYIQLMQNVSFVFIGTDKEAMFKLFNRYEAPFFNSGRDLRFYAD